MMTKGTLEIIEDAKQAIDSHRLKAISEDIGRPIKLPLCECPDCRPEAWPDNIQDLLDQDARV